MARGDGIGAPEPARGEPTPATPALPHWQHLEPNRAREFSGAVYDPAIVKRMYPDEIYAWEHYKTTPSLIDLARSDAWEACAVPPVSLAHSEEGVRADGRTWHYAIVDGHHRLNAAKRADTGGEPPCVPAIVTSRWTPDANGNAIGYAGAPHARQDESLSQAWNRSAQAQSVHAPERVAETSVWATRQLEVSLPGLDDTLTLNDIADRLDRFKRPDEFLRENRGETVRARVTLQAIPHAAPLSPNQDRVVDLVFSNVDLQSTSWASVFQDSAPLADKFPPGAAAAYPILLVQVQQDPTMFQSEY